MITLMELLIRDVFFIPDVFSNMKKKRWKHIEKVPAKISDFSTLSQNFFDAFPTLFLHFSPHVFLRFSYASTYRDFNIISSNVESSYSHFELD